MLNADVPSFFQLLEQHFDITQFVPGSFYNAFYQHLGRKRDYPLTGFLSAAALKPVLSDFFALHPDIHPSTFLGDSAFDTIDTYGFLKNEFHFSKALIPYNPRNESSLKKVGYNEYGYPTCPQDPSLAMKYAGHCHEEGRADRDKWVCPKVHMVNGQWVCDCDNPCSTAKKGLTTYTYDNLDFRMFLGIQRDSLEWATCALPDANPAVMQPPRLMSF